MDVSFAPVYLSNRDHSFSSQWNSHARLFGMGTESCLDDNSFVLPPIQQPLRINFSFSFDGANPTCAFLSSFVAALERCNEFWTDLNYTPSFEIPTNCSVRIKLSCRIFSLMKTKNLLEQPLSTLKHMNFHLMSVSTLNVSADFVGMAKSFEDALHQANEYIVSLFLSQLEFQFPLVFSRICRRRFLQQEASLGSVSYSLTGTPTMIPQLIKIISEDRTCTTCYHVLELSSNRRKVARLEKLKEGVSPFQVIRHS